MEIQVADNEIIGEIDFIDPLMHNKKENAQKLRKWATELILRTSTEMHEQKGSEINDT